MVCKKVKACCDVVQNEYEWCGECRRETTDPKIVCEEHKKRYCLLNDKRYSVVEFKMDDGIIRNEDNKNKCDYLYVVKEPSHPVAIFVELKGRDVKHALEQIMESVTTYYRDFHYCRILGRIVCKCVPRITNDDNLIKIRKEKNIKWNWRLKKIKWKIDACYKN